MAIIRADSHQKTADTHTLTADYRFGTAVMAGGIELGGAASVEYSRAAPAVVAASGWPLRIWPVRERIPVTPTAVAYHYPAHGGVRIGGTSGVTLRRVFAAEASGGAYLRKAAKSARRRAFMSEGHLGIAGQAIASSTHAEQAKYGLFVLGGAVLTVHRGPTPAQREEELWLIAA